MIVSTKLQFEWTSRFDIEDLGQEVIWGELPTLPRGPWIKETIEVGISMADVLKTTGPKAI